MNISNLKDVSQLMHKLMSLVTIKWLSKKIRICRQLSHKDEYFLYSEQKILLPIKKIENDILIITTALYELAKYNFTKTYKKEAGTINTYVFITITLERNTVLAS